ncbi:MULTISPECIES: histidine phosphatase family protein [Pacificibacter]|uniref:histidine phosphatase family protein n=1 Tax=Pacificibacter TaxID=1042323 RepID=UPI001C09F490|nr:MULTISPECIES: histidine phosphatase family protein [Pacificibacter]MBU2937668.1 histidine phosphatase family protein [Pacificibacter marinus]MDO6616162.1 histidine phosphatase family protein [Pacificibacter sp. 1_MG-2023]
MSRIWLVRHGPTHVKTFVGWTDVPADLSDTAAIVRLENALPVDVPIVSSTLDRAIKTADAIQGTRLRLPHDPRLRETHFGEWENRSWSQIQALDPALARRVFEDPGQHAPPGGENWHDFSARVYSGLDAITGDAIVVAHMGVILAVLQRALGCSAYEALGHKIDNLSITSIARATPQSPTWSAHMINHIP